MEDRITEGPSHGQSDVSASLMKYGVMVEVRCDDQSTACGINWEAALRLGEWLVERAKAAGAGGHEA